MINTVNILTSELLANLANGYTWLKKEDLGYGSIEEKYGANENQIAIIRKHPALKDAETTATIINIIDDTVDLKQIVDATEIQAEHTDKPSSPIQIPFSGDSVNKGSAAQVEHSTSAMEGSLREDASKAFNQI